MAVTADDVRRIAVLARLGLGEDRVPALVHELNTILEHMAILAAVNTDGIEATAGFGTSGTPLREDGGRPIPLARPPTSFAPRTRDGFFLVPRLATHEDPDPEIG